MFTTTYTFKFILDWFHHSKFQHLVLFVCGYDTNPNIVETIVHNQSDIDYLTGEDIAYIFFENAEKGQEPTIPQRIVNYHIPKESIRQNYALAEEVCNYFHIKRYHLPALLVISKDNNYDLFPVNSTHDLNMYLQPIGIVTSFQKDYQSIEKDISKILNLPKGLQTYRENLETAVEQLSKFEAYYNFYKADPSITNRIEKSYKTLLAELKLKGIKQNEFEEVFKNGTHYDLDTIQEKLISFGLTSNYIPIIESLVKDLNSIGIFQRFDSREGTVSVQVEKAFERSLKEAQILQVRIKKLNETIQECQQLAATSGQRLAELNQQKHEIIDIYATKLRKCIFMPYGKEFLQQLINDKLIDIILLLQWVRDNSLNMNTIIERLNIQVEEERFDTFISCKSQDYEAAEEVYSLLKENGYHPFLASKTLRILASDNYGYIIRKVISRCKNMIVFASDIHYITTSYVSTEWNQYLDELSAGLNSGKLFSIVPSGTSAHQLPPGLKTKQFFTLDSYREQLLSYLVDTTETGNLQDCTKKTKTILQRKEGFLRRLRRWFGKIVSV